MLLIFDWLSLFFISRVFLISGLVTFYSGSYIRGERFFSRFITILLLFIFRIGLLIFRPNLIRILLG